MRYLARDSDLIPTDAFLQAKMDEWLFWEQYSHEPAIAVVRFLVALKGINRSTIDPQLILKGEAALNLMENHLNGCDYLVGNTLSLADIALFAYTQFAEEGGFSLAPHPGITAWLQRIKNLLAC